MKNLFPIIFLFIHLSFLNAQTKRSITTDLGKDYGQKTLKLYAFDFESNEYKFLKMQKTDAEGKANFKLKLEDNTLLKLEPHEKTYLLLGVGKESTVKIIQKEKQWTIEDSETSREMRTFKKEFQALQKNYFAKLKVEMQEAMKAEDKAKVAQLEQEVGKKLPLFIQDFEKMIRAIKNPVAIYYACTYLDDNKNKDFLAEMTEKMLKLYPDSEISQNMQRHLNKLQGLAVGTLAPDFEGNDTKGNTYKLSQFKGKYVFVDFWASWCLACRVENPKLMNVYQNYHNANFEMISISIDNNAENWHKALSKDKLIGSQILDKESKIAKVYGVSSLPQNVLLDPTGKIVAKNLKAEDLEQKLKEILK